VEELGVFNNIEIKKVHVATCITPPAFYRLRCK